MPHQIYTITDFEIVAPYTLRLTFDDGTVKTIDLSPLLRGELYSPLRELDFFNKVKLNPEIGTIVWPNEADFDPATLHDWDEVGSEMIEMASKWEVKDKPVENLTLDQILRFAHRLKPRDKLKLLRVLAQDIESSIDEIDSLEPNQRYPTYMSNVEPRTVKVLKETNKELETEKPEQEAK